MYDNKYNFLSFMSQWRNDNNSSIYRCSVLASDNKLL